MIIKNIVIEEESTLTARSIVNKCKAVVVATYVTAILSVVSIILGVFLLINGFEGFDIFFFSAAIVAAMCLIHIIVCNNYSTCRRVLFKLNKRRIEQYQGLTTYQVLSDMVHDRDISQFLWNPMFLEIICGEAEHYTLIVDADCHCKLINVDNDDVIDTGKYVSCNGVDTRFEGAKDSVTLYISGTARWYLIDSSLREHEGISVLSS